jgi:hypothetical protein
MRTPVKARKTRDVSALAWMDAAWERRNGSDMNDKIEIGLTGLIAHGRPCELIGTSERENNRGRQEIFRGPQERV